MERLLDTVFRPAFGNPVLDRRHDGARLDLSGPLAFTTDSYVVQPLFFPGGDIGTLAINGTVNDLAMCGARPSCLSAGFILEEGLAIATASPHRRLDAATPRRRPASRSSPATSRSSIAARPTSIFINTVRGRTRGRPRRPSSRSASGPATP